MARNVSIQLPQWVNNGSPAWVLECPLLGEERKSISGGWRSACSQRTKSLRDSLLGQTVRAAGGNHQ